MMILRLEFSSVFVNFFVSYFFIFVAEIIINSFEKLTSFHSDFWLKFRHYDNENNPV